MLLESIPVHSCKCTAVRQLQDPKHGVMASARHNLRTNRARSKLTIPLAYVFLWQYLGVRMIEHFLDFSAVLADHEEKNGSKENGENLKPRESVHTTPLVVHPRFPYPSRPGG